MSQQQKQAAAQAALAYVPDRDAVIGVGSGSTVDCFIDALATIKGQIRAVVASSEASAARLRARGINVWDLNAVDHLPVYIDGTDEVNGYLQLLKGGGGALTREKIVAAVAEQFVCIADQSKQVAMLGRFPLPLEVIPMARSYVARQMFKFGGRAELRQGFVTDNGNIILDVHGLKITEPAHTEEELNQIVGIVSNGLFAQRHADVLLLATDHGVETLR